MNYTPGRQKYQVAAGGRLESYTRLPTTTKRNWFPPVPYQDPAGPDHRGLAAAVFCWPMRSWSYLSDLKLATV